MTLANIIVNSILLGLILVTQIVNYPLFLKVSSANFFDYHRYYKKRISIIVVPLMITELVLSGVMLFLLPNITHTIIFLFIIIIWLSTFLIQVPIHNSLINNFNTNQIKHLILSNWIRTIFWFLKLIILIIS